VLLRIVCRPGIPTDCAALVERMSADAATLSLVNLGAEARSIIVQGGAYGEHTINSFTIEGSDGGAVDVGGAAFTITLAAGCGARLQVSMERYAKPVCLLSRLYIINAIFLPR
jgi:hypothetical protein